VNRHLATLEDLEDLLQPALSSLGDLDGTVRAASQLTTVAMSARKSDS
jgi:hypothetical protein